MLGCEGVGPKSGMSTDNNTEGDGNDNENKGRERVLIPGPDHDG
jgi:hypothetical protein